MDSDAIFAAEALSWLSAAGTTGVYHSRSSGSVVVPIALERSVELIDDRGMMRRSDMATIPSGLVEIALCDTVEIEGTTWEVLGLVDDPGHLTRFYVGAV